MPKKVDPCPPPDKGPSQLDGLFTEADILAKRHELEMSQEDQHKTEIAGLENRICQLKQRKQNEEAQYEIELHEVSEQVRQAEGRLCAAREQHEQCLQDIKDQYAEQRAGFVQQLEDLKRAVERDRQTMEAKKIEIEKMEQQALKGQDKRAMIQEGLMREIEELQDRLSNLTKEHENKKSVMKEEADERIRNFKADSERIKGQLEEVRTDAERRNREFRIQELQLRRTGEDQQLQSRLDREEMQVRFGPILMEKEDLVKRIAFLQNKISHRREDEKRKAQDIVKQFDEIYFDRESGFEREKEENERQRQDKDEELRKKEAELVKVRQEHDTRIREINERIDLRTKEMEKEILNQNERQRRQLEQITNRERHKAIEDEIHSKNIGLMNIESEQQAEEALLQSRLKSLTEKEKLLRDGLNAKHMKHSDFITCLENDLNSNQSKAANEHREFLVLKEGLDNKVSDARRALECDIRNAIDRLNEINKEICDVKRCMKEREEAAQDKGDSVERRISDETRRLGNLKGDLEEQIPPLQEKHNELKQKMKDDKQRHEAKMKSLTEEADSVGKDHQDELNRMEDMVDGTREQYKNETDNLMQTLKDLLESNDELRSRHEKEIFALNVNLVRALEGASLPGMDGIEVTGRLNKIKNLQDEYTRKSAEYDNINFEYFKEACEPNPENEKELKKLLKYRNKLAKDLKTDGIDRPEERLKILENLVERNKHKKSDLSNKPQVMDNIDEAKMKNSELKEQLNRKKKDLQDLMQKRQKEISGLTKQVQEQTKKHHRKSECDSTHHASLINCVLDEMGLGEPAQQSVKGDEKASIEQNTVSVAPIKETSKTADEASDKENKKASESPDKEENPSEKPT